MSKVIWERKVLAPDEANEYEMAEQIEEAAGKFKMAGDLVIDGCNKEYVITVSIEELDA